MDTFATSARHLATHPHVLPIEIAATEPFHVVGTDGKKFIDFTSGWCVGNAGWGNKELRDSIKKYRGPDYVAPAFHYEPWAGLAKKLCEIAPGNMGTCFRCTGGSEAVDLALQLAYASTGRKKMLSIEGSYHGNTMAALSVGASAGLEKFPVRMPGMRKIKPPLDRNFLEQLEHLLSAKDVAAFIMEPVSMNLGIEIPDANFMKTMQRLCRKYGTLIIADEVACGFGRTGKLFASEFYGLNPDVICLAKGLSSGYGGIGAMLTTNRIFKKAKGKLSFYSTYGWHPLATEAALANIKFLTDQKTRLMDKVMQSSSELRTSLSQMPFKKGGSLRITGLAIAAELQDQKYAEKVKKACLRNGLLLTTQQSKLVMFPPLTVTSSVIRKAMMALEKSI